MTASIPAFYFDPAGLGRLADGAREAFRSAAPFPHVVLDDFLPRPILDLLVREFPGPDDADWEVHGPGRAPASGDRAVDKLACSDETKFGPFTRHFMGQLNSATFLAFLEDLTGTAGILPDVTYSHCGMHSTGRGGRLMLHTDVNRHPHGWKLHQYLNLILYLDPDWREEYGGHLELRDLEGETTRRILPAGNRVVVFETSTSSVHGHPGPLTCPPGRRRNSLAVYYYLRDRPAGPGYAGMQRAVRWFPTTDEERRFGRERFAAALARLDAYAGRTVAVHADVIPFEMPGERIDAHGAVPLRFLTPADVDGGAAGPVPAGHRPIALLGGRGADAIACVVNREGDLFVARGGDRSDLLWVGYLDEVLDGIERG